MDEHAAKNCQDTATILNRDFLQNIATEVPERISISDLREQQIIRRWHFMNLLLIFMSISALILLFIIIALFVPFLSDFFYYEDSESEHLMYSTLISNNSNSRVKRDIAETSKLSTNELSVPLISKRPNYFIRSKNQHLNQVEKKSTACDGRFQMCSDQKGMDIFSRNKICEKETSEFWKEMKKYSKEGIGDFKRYNDLVTKILQLSDFCMNINSDSIPRHVVNKRMHPSGRQQFQGVYGPTGPEGPGEAIRTSQQLTVSLPRVVQQTCVLQQDGHYACNPPLPQPVKQPSQVPNMYSPVHVPTALASPNPYYLPTLAGRPLLAPVARPPYTMQAPPNSIINIHCSNNPDYQTVAYPTVHGVSEYTQRSRHNSNYMPSSQKQSQIISYFPPSTSPTKGSIGRCDTRERFCVDSCIPTKSWCDGQIDCSDASDETSCTCAEYLPHRKICDGIFDCPDMGDELACFGCKEHEFSCDDWDKMRKEQPTCLPLTARCDGIEQCPNGKDEHDCVLLAPVIDNHQTFFISYNEGFLHKNFKGVWYPACNDRHLSLWPRKACEAEQGHVHPTDNLKEPFVHYFHHKHHYRGLYVTDVNGYEELTHHCLKNNVAYVHCPEMECGERNYEEPPTEKKRKIPFFNFSFRSDGIENDPVFLHYISAMERLSQMNNTNTEQNSRRFKRSVQTSASMSNHRSPHNKDMTLMSLVTSTPIFKYSIPHNKDSTIKLPENDSHILNSSSSHSNSGVLTPPLSHENPSNSTKSWPKQSDKRKRRKITGRIVGGTDSASGEWPWVVAIYQDGTFHCGGSIITPVFILSAAHCFYKLDDHYYEIQAGLLRRLSFSPQIQIRQVDNVTIHSNYDSETMHNDIALIHLKERLMFNRWVRPICVPSPRAGFPQAGDVCTAVGWGATHEHGPDPDHLKKVDVPILTICPHDNDNENEAICAGYMDGGKDSCQGDSGGPLLCRPYPGSGKQWYLSGIVSHGEGCARAREPGVYTRVTAFYQWIQNTMRSNSGTKTLKKCPGRKCHDGRCISEEEVCDGKVDCLGAQDEIDCVSTTYNNNIHSRTVESKEKKKIESELLPKKFQLLKNEYHKEESVSAQIPTTFQAAPKNSEFHDNISSFISTEKGVPVSTPLMKTTNIDIPSSEATKSISEKPVYSTSIKSTFRSLDSNFLGKDSSTSSWNDSSTSSEEESSETSSSSDSNIFSLLSSTSSPDKAVDDISTTILYDISLMSHEDSYNPMIFQAKVITENSSDFFLCKSLNQNIQSQYYCDKIVDCVDGSDEFNCSCRDYIRHNYKHLICNNKVDCRDGSDEVGCISPCNSTYYYENLISSCVSIEKRCNGIRDLDGGEDELNCYALTDDPEHIELADDGYPKVNEEGILIFNEKNEWIPLCSEDTRIKYETLEMVEKIPSDKYKCDLVRVRILPKPVVNNKLAHWLVILSSEGHEISSGVLIDKSWIIAISDSIKDHGITTEYLSASAGRLIGPAIGIYEQNKEIDLVIPVPDTDLSLLRLSSPFQLSHGVTYLPLRDMTDLERIPALDFCYAMGYVNNTVLHVIQVEEENNCPSNKSCFSANETQQLQMTGNSLWSGSVICNSDGGAFVACLFDKISISSSPFSFKCSLFTSNDTQEIYNIVDHKMDTEGLCKTCLSVRCERGQCLDWSAVLDGVYDCIGGEDERPDLIMKKRLNKPHNNYARICKKGEMQCAGWMCIEADAICDGVKDCIDQSDESSGCNNNCAEFIGLVYPEKLCDSFVNCGDRSDESWDVCGPTFACQYNSSFNCSKSGGCISQSLMCDGVSDCPRGEDEEGCLALKRSPNNRKEGTVIMNVMGTWIPYCFNGSLSTSYQEIMCSVLGYQQVVGVTESYSDEHYLSIEQFSKIDLPSGSFDLLLNRPSSSFSDVKGKCNVITIKCQ